MAEEAGTENRVRCAVQTVVSAVLMAVVISLVVAGRIATWYCTEMEALVAGWPYWLGAASVGIPTYWYLSR